LKVEIVLNRDGEQSILSYDYTLRHPDEKPMVLDVLLQAQATTVPDLAYRYGCRARNCGVCTIDINGRPRLACRARIREGDRLSPVGTLPVLADLVVRRDGVARQMRGRLNNGVHGNDLNVQAPDDYHALTACIECYACLNGCMMHERNAALNGTDPGAGYRWGNPFSLLKLQLIRLDPATAEFEKEAALDNAIELGLDACEKCPGCKCGIGIDLKRKVVKALAEAAQERPSPNR
jgi:succinate dehydrogenase / fumarate reductase iron-sulfur subunit